MNNTEVRKAVFENNLKMYQIAEKIGINSYTLSHWMQTELSPERKARVLNAIDILSLQEKK